MYKIFLSITELEDLKRHISKHYPGFELLGHVQWSYYLDTKVGKEIVSDINGFELVIEVAEQGEYYTFQGHWTVQQFDEKFGKFYRP